MHRINSDKLLLLIIAVALIHTLPFYGQSAKNNKAFMLQIEGTGNNQFTGRGNKSEVLSMIKITNTDESPIKIKEYTICLYGDTPYKDLTKVKIFATDTCDVFDSKKEHDYTLLSEFVPSKEQHKYTISGNLLQAGENHIWIVADISETAIEGNFAGAYFETITMSDNKKIVVPDKNTDSRQILLAYKPIFQPGDYGSKNYRIPAIITADDNSLVILADKRKFNEIDLPEDIDVITKRSTDNGKTWSEPVTIAEGTGRFQGFGDPAIVKTKSGKLISVFVGGQGLWGSTPDNPNRTYISESYDNGITWSEPRDITPQLFGSECSDPIRKKWLASFCASGRGIQTRDGRIMFVAAVRENSEYSLSNYLYYSDDNGVTWNVSERAFTGGDEAKVVELNNGDILMSIRNKNKGKRIFVVSKDNGITWSLTKNHDDLFEPACNGEIIRYTSVLDGYDKDRLLHTITNHISDRKNVSIFLSYDEGESWSVKKSICPTASAYSSVTILPDGTIGVFFEKEKNDMSLYFANFTLDWLTDCNDTYMPPKNSK